jgi:hypothetical protein
MPMPISPVRAATALLRPDPWWDAEVVDGVLVDEPAPGSRPSPVGGAALYDASGRPSAGQRFGRLVSVLA